MATTIPPNRARFTAAELQAVFGPCDFPGSFESVSSVTTDSRGILDGALFVALRGDRFDGHDYVGSAIARGARAVLIEREHARALTIPEGTAVLTVPDTLTALGDLARAHRRRWRGKLVAIGGSAGKTTTKGAVRAILEELRAGRVHSTPGNLNNRIGVPMTLLTLEDRHELSVIEMGTNQAGEMAELARIAEPDVALLTLIELEHTSGLGDMDGVEREECALFEAIAKRGGVLLGNLDDGRIRAALRRSLDCESLGYGEHPDATVRIAERVVQDDLRVRLRLIAGENELIVNTHLAGRPGALAVAAGVLVASVLLGKPPAAAALENALAGAGERGRASLRTHESGALIFDDSYNANPASMAAGIESARELANASGARLVLVLGEMRELGEQSSAEHKRLGRKVGDAGASRVIFVGGDAVFAAQTAREQGQVVEFVDSAEEARELIEDTLGPGDLVLLKGSRGLSLERIFQGDEPMSNLS